MLNSEEYASAGKQRARRLAQHWARRMKSEDGRMHGEYKTPGGKLVAVDFELADRRLRDVMVSGDFFLYPEEAIDSITSALAGLPEDSDEGAVARAVQQAIPAGTELLGFSPEAIAIAVRRALDVQPG
jgi:lipoate-protein ligase A